MRKIYLAVMAWLLVSIAATTATAQNLPPLQPEQDACNALPLCGGVYSTTYSYTGYGTKLEQSQLAGACFDETNSVWLKLQVATAGNISFTITPVLATNDYDFAVYNITGKTCDSINAGTRIRCNGCDITSSPGGLTGCSPTGVGTVSGPGAGVAFISSIAANAGDTYLIMIDNFYQGAQSGFSIDFNTSTATFVSAAPPVYDSIAKACSYADSLHVYMNKQIKCPSLQSNGSDFQLFPPAATVVSAIGGSCSGTNGFTKDFTIKFSATLPPGTYTLKPKNGLDGNTLLDVCNVAQALTDSIVFVVPQPIAIGQTDTITCVNNAVQLNAGVTGGAFTSLTYSWTPATYLSNSTIANPIARPPSNITYTLTVTPDNMAACAVRKAIRIDVLQGFNLTNNDTSVCYGASVTLNAVGDARYNYNWAPATNLSTPTGASTVATPGSTTTYTVVASHAGCADSSRSVRITVQPGPAVFIGPDLTLCYGDTLHMNPVINPDTFSSYIYNWSPAAVFNDATVKNPIFTATADAEVILQVSTTAGCKGSDTAMITVIPNKFITITADTGICPGNAVKLQVSGGDIYRWEPSGDLSSDTASSVIATPLTTTTYTVFASNRTYGCRDTGMVQVTIYPRALISLPDSVLIYPGESYAINPGGNCLYFQWFPPAGLTNSHIANPVASPEVNTRYFVTATTETGCVTNDSIDVNVSLETVIDMPNAFSPGLQPNHIFKPAYRGNVTLKMFKIYNRWGQKVFESANINDGWDGTLNGKPQDVGVYVYFIEASLPGGKVFKKQGNVTLLR